MSLHVVAVFHQGRVGGPARSLAAVTRWLAETERMTILFPEEGDAAAEYREARIDEGFGHVVHKALMAGRPVVSGAGRERMSRRFRAERNLAAWRSVLETVAR